jgi:hypothetical protein
MKTRTLGNGLEVSALGLGYRGPELWLRHRGEQGGRHCADPCRR